MIDTIIDLFVYGCVGIIAMLIGYAIIDFVIPCDFPKEIKEGNKAIGWVSAGIYIGLGTIIKSALQTFKIDDAPLKLIHGIIDSLFFSAAGIIFFIIAYFVVDLLNKKYNFNEELKAKNEAIGIMIMGIFIGMALIISGVIQ